METVWYIPLLAAVLPAVLLMVWIWWRDKYQREPVQQLLKGFAYGLASVVLALVIANPLALLWEADSYSALPNALYMAFLVAAIPEELAKLFWLHRLLRNNPYYDEFMDGIVYAVCVGLGFAAFENVGYVFGAGDNWLGTSVVRAVLSVPGHYAFAVIMGYFYSMWRMGGRRYYIVLTLLAPVVAHGVFDFLLMYADGMADEPEVVGLLFVLFMAFLVFMHTRCRRAIQAHLATDRERMQKSAAAERENDDYAPRYHRY